MFLFPLSDNVQRHKYQKSEDGKVNLLDISLPEFYGNIKHWNTFKVKFNSLISSKLLLSEM